MNTRFLSLTCLTLLLPAILTGCSTASSAPTGAVLPALLEDGSVALTSPARLPQAREPQAAVSGGGGVFVAFGAGDELYCAHSPDGGKTFLPPIDVGSAGKLALGMRRGPRIAATPNAVVISAVFGESGGGKDGDLLAWRSADNGKTWQGPAKISDAPGAAREGLHAMAAASNGTLACAWLDLRSGNGTEIWASVSTDSGKTWGKNRRVYQSPDGTVCECCHPSVVFGPDHTLYVMWRNALGGARDLYVARSGDQGRTFTTAQKLGTGTWPLNACPMDGGAAAVQQNGNIETIWRREKTVYAARPGQREKMLGTGEQGWVAAGADGPYYAWLTKRGGALNVLAPGTNAPRMIAAHADDPMVAAPASGGGSGPVVVVWRDTSDATGEIRSQTLASR